MINSGSISSQNGNPDSGPFIFVIDTSITDFSLSPSGQFQLPITNGLTYDYRVSWGDGVVESYNTDVSPTHTYPNSGVYNVSIYGTYPEIIFDPVDINSPLTDGYKVVDIIAWGKNTWQNMVDMFRRTSLGALNNGISCYDTPDLSGATSLFAMFSNADNNNPNTQVYYLRNCERWDVSSINTFQRLFSNCRFDPLVSNWDMSSATNIVSMFNGNFYFNQPLNEWDVTAVEFMDSVFFRALSFNQNINSWDLPSIPPNNNNRSDSLFDKATDFNQDLKDWPWETWDTIKDTFLDASDFNQDISDWGIGRVDSTDGNNAFKNSGMSKQNYDLFLDSMANQTYGTTGNNVVFDISPTPYSQTQSTNRQLLIDTFGWTIIDGGLEKVITVGSNGSVNEFGFANGSATEQYGSMTSNTLEGVLFDEFKLYYNSVNNSYSCEINFYDNIPADISQELVVTIEGISISLQYTPDYPNLGDYSYSAHSFGGENTDLENLYNLFSSNVGSTYDWIFDEIFSLDVGQSGTAGSSNIYTGYALFVSSGGITKPEWFDTGDNIDAYTTLVNSSLTSYRFIISGFTELADVGTVSLIVDDLEVELNKSGANYLTSGSVETVGGLVNDIDTYLTSQIGNTIYNTSISTERVNDGLVVGRFNMVNNGVPYEAYGFGSSISTLGETFGSFKPTLNTSLGDEILALNVFRSTNENTYTLILETVNVPTNTSINVSFNSTQPITLVYDSLLGYYIAQSTSITLNQDIIDTYIYFKINKGLNIGEPLVTILP